MTWFKVDDGWHKHRKRIRTGVDLEGMAAQGLWAAAGSWASDELTDGWVPVEVVDYLSPKLGRKLAARLVHSSLWTAETRNGEEGWQFHDWEVSNPTREEELAKVAKKSSGGTLGNHRRWHAGQKIDPRCPYCLPAIGAPSDRPSVYRSDDRSDMGSVERSEDRSVERNGTESLANPPSRPVPTRPLSSKSKSGTQDLRVSLTKQDHPNGSNQNRDDGLAEDERLRRRWQGTECPEHRSPSIANCYECGIGHKDHRYWTHHDWSKREAK